MIKIVAVAVLLSAVLVSARPALAASGEGRVSDERVIVPVPRATLVLKPVPVPVQPEASRRGALLAGVGEG
jgi:hypothetical protein